MNFNRDTAYRSVPTGNYSEAKVVVHVSHGKVHEPGQLVKGLFVITANERLSCGDITLSMRLVGQSEVWTKCGGVVTLHAFFKQTVHNFLSLAPATSPAFPASAATLEPGMSYEVPSAFRLPLGIPSGSCTHAVNDALVRKAHLMLPPSMRLRRWGTSRHPSTRLQTMLRCHI